MKFFVFFFSLAFLLSGCDEIPLKIPSRGKVAEMSITDTPDVEPPPVDVDFESFRGERLEKYYEILDPALLDKQFSLSGTVSGYPLISSYHQIEEPYPEAISSVALPYLVYAHLYNPALIPVSISGNMTFLCARSDGYSYGGSHYIVLPFSGFFNFASSYAVSPNFVNVMNEPYTIKKSFSHSSLELPKTEDYSDPYRDYKAKTISLVFSVDMFKPYAAGYKCPYDQGVFSRNHAIWWDVGDRSFTVDVPLSTEIFEPFIHKSREFFQYLNFTIKYKPEIKVMGFFDNTAIVSRYEWKPEENAVTVYLKPYDAPFLGDVITYWVQTEDGTTLEKTVRIVE